MNFSISTHENVKDLATDGATNFLKLRMPGFENCGFKHNHRLVEWRKMQVSICLMVKKLSKSNIKKIIMKMILKARMIFSKDEHNYACNCFSKGFAWLAQ